MIATIGSNALVVEGGAMRCVFSCGILDRFLTEQFSPFHSFWGVSAGASNLAAYLAKMPKRNLKIYLDYSRRKEFLSPWRFLRGGDFIDLDWMWRITLEELGMDKAALVADNRPFFLGVTRQDTGAAEYHTPNIDALAETIKASSALPVLYRKGVLLGPYHYVDGGVSDAIPIAEAIRRGATNIMVLRSRPKHYRQSPTKMGPLLMRLLKDTPALIEPMLVRDQRYNQTIELIRNPPPGVNILEICPPETFQLKRLSQKYDDLLQSYQLGDQFGLEAINQWQQQIADTAAVSA